MLAWLRGSSHLTKDIIRLCGIEQKTLPGKNKGLAVSSQWSDFYWVGQRGHLVYP